MWKLLKHLFTPPSCFGFYRGGFTCERDDVATKVATFTISDWQGLAYHADAMEEGDRLCIVAGGRVIETRVLADPRPEASELAALLNGGEQ